jgi:hypothetical protein
MKTPQEYETMETTATIFASTLTVWVAIVGIMLLIG